MKKILFTVLTVFFCFCLCSVAFASEVEIPQESITEESSLVDSIMAKFTDSSFWVAIIGALTTVVAVIGSIATFIKKIKQVIELVKSKADSTTVANAIKEATEESTKAFAGKLDEVKAELQKCTDREEELTTLIALLINNSNINPHSKAEIMARVSGLKQLTGNVIQVVKEVEAEVEKAKAEEPKPEIQALEKVVNKIALD